MTKSIILIICGCITAGTTMNLAHGWSYIVEASNTLSKIAGSNIPGPVWGTSGSLKNVLKWNPEIKNPNVILPGQIIEIKLENPHETKTELQPIIPEKKMENSTPPSSTQEFYTISPSFFSLGLGVSAISYSQTGANLFSMTELTLKGNGIYHLPNSLWKLGGKSYLTVLPITQNLSEVNVKFFGIQGWAGYPVKGFQETWKLFLMGGAHYNTMWVSGKGRAGYNNILGPMLFPVIEKSLPRSQRISFYLKYSPIFDTLGGSFGILSISNREFETGVAWIHPLTERNSLTVTLDYSDFHLKHNATQADTEVLSAAVGIGW